MYTMVLLSGGIGKRMNNTVPKQYMLLAGKPVIMHTLERVDQIPEITEVIVVCAEEYISSIRLMLDQYGVKKKVEFATAGNTRQASVKSGLAHVKTESVIIHEAARPFVKVNDMKRLVDSEFENAILGTEIPFTVLKAHECIEGNLNRSELVNVQLPQKFNTNLLIEAHNRAERENMEFTEDAGMIFYYFPEERVKVCPGMEYNIKLTTRMDILIGEQIYEEEFRRRK